MSHEHQQNYEEAHSKICRITQGETSGIASYLDYYCKITGEPAVYKQIIEAFGYRLDENLFDVDNHSYHSLAAQQCCTRIYGALAQKLLGMEEKIVAHATNKQDKYLISGFTRTKEEILKTQSNFAAFEQQFATEIAAEKQGTSFVSDNAMIDKTLKELRTAISGTWTPECVEVTDSTGTRRPAELPGSGRLSQIAKASKRERKQLLTLQI